jgi:hypothetical protein
MRYEFRSIVIDDDGLHIGGLLCPDRFERKNVLAEGAAEIESKHEILVILVKVLLADFSTLAVGPQDRVVVCLFIHVDDALHPVSVDEVV